MWTNGKDDTEADGVTAELGALSRIARALLIGSCACAWACSSTGCHKERNDFPLSDVAPSSAFQTRTLPPVPEPAPLPSVAPPSVAAEPQKWTPSGYLLLSSERLAELRQGKGGREWQTVRANAEESVKSPDLDHSSPENLALVYLVTSNARYAQAAYALEHTQEATVDVRRDSYLDFGQLLRGAAIVLNYCAAALNPDQKKDLANYLEKWTHELWFDNKGSGWGMNDRGNNYFMSFLEGTAYAAYALKAANHPSGESLVALLREKIERPDGLLPYLNTRAKGGDWEEGANYGERAKERMFSAFAAAASMGGPNYFNQTRFASDSLIYAVYQLEPGKRFMAPTGDLSRDSSMPVSPLDRDYIQLATFYTSDETARGYGAWLLTEVVPSYSMSFNLRSLYYRDAIYGTPGTPTPPTNLPLAYRSRGTEWINARSGWGDGATSVTILATPLLDQSHAHCDTGSFLIWKGGWQAVDAATYGRSGLNWEPGAHNMIQVTGSERRPEKSRGLVRYAATSDYVYASIDGTNLFAKRTARGEDETLLDEWTREVVYVRPDTVVTYDRVAPKPAGVDYSWRLHFASKPGQNGEQYSALNGGGGASLVFLSDGQQKVAPDSDIEEPITSWRVEVGPNPSGRYAAVVAVGSGAPPRLAAAAVHGPGIEGAAWNNQVVLFSTAPRGAPARLPFAYTLDGIAARTHTLVDIDVPVDVAVDRDRSTTTVRVSRGSEYAPDQGVIHFTK